MKAVLTCTGCDAGLSASSVARLAKEHFNEQGAYRQYAARMLKTGAANTRAAEFRGDGTGTTTSDLGSIAGVENMRQQALSALDATPQQQQNFTTHTSRCFLNNSIGTLPCEGLLCEEEAFPWRQSQLHPMSPMGSVSAPPDVCPQSCSATYRLNMRLYGMDTFIGVADVVHRQDSQLVLHDGHKALGALVARKRARVVERVVRQRRQRKAALVGVAQPRAAAERQHAALPANLGGTWVRAGAGACVRRGCGGGMQEMGGKAGRLLDGCTWKATGRGGGEAGHAVQVVAGVCSEGWWLKQKGGRMGVPEWEHGCIGSQRGGCVADEAAQHKGCGRHGVFRVLEEQPGGHATHPALIRDRGHGVFRLLQEWRRRQGRA
eukprot:360636-Chlamydomonas_euryale.AAC.2